MPKDIAAELRKAIDKSKLSHLQIALKTGLTPSVITRFMAGKDMGIHRAAKIAAFLGLELKKPKKT